MTPSVTNQSRAIMRDVTVLVLQNAPVTGSTIPAAIDYLGVIESVELGLKREFIDTTAAADNHTSSRAVRWGRGSVRFVGFSDTSGSKFALLFAQGGHATLQLTEAASGDSYILIVTCTEFSKALGHVANRDTLTLAQEGVPYFGSAGATPAAMNLE